MKAEHHNQLIDQQFGPRAQAYLTSAVHAAGEDLDLMAQWVGMRPDAKALDVGCGAGHAAFRLAPQVGHVVASDLSPSMLSVVEQEARRRGLANLDVQACTAQELPWPDSSFDLVLSRYSAHHWHDLPGGLTEMRRVLKPDGMALFMDVVSPGVPLLDTWLQSLELLRDPSHVRNASIAQWQQHLEAAHFTVERHATFRLRLAFGPWIERMKTPPEHVAAIRSLQQRADQQVSEYFAFEDDGSFTVDTVLIAARPAADSAARG